MNKFTYVLLLIPTIVLAQIHLDETWKDAINPIFENNGSSKVLFGLQIAYPIIFIDL